VGRLLDLYKTATSRFTTTSAPRSSTVTSTVIKPLASIVSSASEDLTTSDGRRDYAPLPAPPVAFKRWKCALHGEELCEKDCSVFSQQNSVYRVHEWNWERKKFEECIKDSWNPLEHGYYNPAQEKKEQEELGAVRRNRRGERKAPYSKENQEARRSLRPKRNLQIRGQEAKLNCGSGRRKDWKAIGCGKSYCGDCTF